MGCSIQNSTDRLPKAAQYNEALLLLKWRIKSKRMKSSNKVLTIILAIFFIAAAPSLTASALDNQSPSALSTQAELLFTNCQTDAQLTDAEKVEALITLLFDVKNDQLTYIDSEDFDFSLFWDAASENIGNLKYFEDDVKAKKGTFLVLNMDLVWTNTTLDFDSIEVTGSNASVKVYESFQYKDSRRYAKDVDAVSSIGIPYTFLLVQRDGRWLITDVDFYDESTDCLRDSDIDVADLLEGRAKACGVPEATDSMDLPVDAELAEASISSSKGDGMMSWKVTKRIRPVAVLHTGSGMFTRLCGGPRCIEK